MLTIALLISASGVDACVPTHGASMNLSVVQIKAKGSCTARDARTAALVRGIDDLGLVGGGR